MLRSPMIVESHLPITDAEVLAMLTNPGLMELHNRSTGNGREAFKELPGGYDNNTVAWSTAPATTMSVGSNADGPAWVALFNTHTTQHFVSLSLQDLGLDSATNYSITDVWTGAPASRGAGTSHVGGPVGPHDVLLLKLMPPAAHRLKR